MSVEDDLLYEFVTESREHLANIEDDLIAMGARKDNPDPEQVNKVFRAIHSIKGCSGFFVQKNISRLSHVMESLLLLIKNKKITAEKDVVDALLAGVDRLNALLGNTEKSNQIEISDVEMKISAFLDRKATGNKEAMPGLVTPTGARVGFEVDKAVLETIPAAHDFLYVLKFDLSHPPAALGNNPVAIINELSKTGRIVDTCLKTMPVNLRASLPEACLEIDVLYSTVLEPDLICIATGLGEDRITQVSWNSELKTSATPAVITEATRMRQPAPPPPVPEPATEEPAMPAEEDEKELPAFVISDEMKKRFFQESMELFDQAEQGLLTLENKPELPGETINDVFRLFHSFKGNCGFLQLKDFERISHAAESILDRVKTNELAISNKVIAGLLETVDALRNGLSKHAVDGDTTLANAQALGNRLHAFLSEPSGAFVAPPTPEVDFPPEGTTARGISQANAPEARPSTTLPVPMLTPKETPAKEADPGAGIQHLTRQDIRVDLNKLDHLINLVGELVIAEAMVVRHPALLNLQDETLEKAVHHLRRVSSDLQDIAISVRMIPLSATFKKMTRLVHDLSQKAAKSVQLELVGEETEVDKTVIELINDPLVHIVRNSMDHGIESREDRSAAGKPETGTITIEARHEGGEVLIIISDDGRGLNREKILNKVIEKGVVSGDGSALTDEQVFKFVFEAGISTAAKVTDISGRGVGMDVVKRNIEKLKGRVEVQSVPGQGTIVILHVPLTLAIIDGMLVRVGDSQYTIPLLSIRESIRAEPAQITCTPDGQEIVRVRNELLPVLRLHKLFARNPDYADLTRGILIVVESNNRLVSLFVDEILGQYQTVIKGLSEYLGKARGVSGCTILGNGEVSLILDIGGLIQIAEDSFKPDTKGAFHGRY